LKKDDKKMRKKGKNNSHLKKKNIFIFMHINIDGRLKKKEIEEN